MPVEFGIRQHLMDGLLQSAFHFTSQVVYNLFDLNLCHEFILGQSSPNALAISGGREAAVRLHRLVGRHRRTRNDS
jgi:hypothetical protein